MKPPRTLEFHKDSKSQVIRNSESMVRGVLHTELPCVTGGATAREAAEHYLRAHQELLGLNESELKCLYLRVQDEPKSTNLEYRFLSDKQQSDVSTITYQLTYSGLPIRDAALSIDLKKLSAGKSGTVEYKVISTGIRRPDKFAVDRLKLPTADAIERLKALDSESLSRCLGIAERAATSKGEYLRLHPYQHLMIYRYDAVRRARALETIRHAGPADGEHLVLPDVPASIHDGEDYVVAAKYFDLEEADQPSIPYLALIEVETYAVLYLEPLAACVNGLVFRVDPMTMQGGPLPNAPNAELNPLRESVPLQGLNAVDGMLRLIGPNVRIEDFRIPQVPAPTKPAGQNFDFEVRSDQFAAVNAYFHCDRFFRLVEELGFDRSDYFPGTTFPIRVDARGSTISGLGAISSGNEVNAQCKMKTTVGPDGSVVFGIGDTIFCLAETNVSPRIGIANDWRVVLHELGGHGVLFGHVHSSFLNFAHSVGDSLAAILGDPDSMAPDKGRTFPWIPAFTRRHDRRVEDGWGWDGEKDRGDDVSQLAREQILSSTHFRLYKSIGGGHPHDASVRRFAAKFTTRLILRAIQALTPETNPRHASDWLRKLLAADAEDWGGFSGGAYAKVIRWAFEKQGLFEGTPPEVDVYIDDGRQGEYPYQIDHANCTAIWNRRAGDGNEGHEAPVPNTVNFAYVKLKNRGIETATSVVVNAFKNRSQTSREYPDDWEPMAPPNRPADDVPPQSPGVIAGPFEWTPSAGDNYILMAVSAARDPNNLSNFSSAEPIPDWRLVPNDNNLGMRKV